MFLPFGVALVAALQSIVASTTNVELQSTCNTYTVSGIPGGFQQRTQADFSGVTSGQDAAAILSTYGFSISNYALNDSPVPHSFVPSNVALGNGTLNLKVSAYSGGGVVDSAEVVTVDTFTYGSVRTVMKSSSVPGVVEGNFFYLNDNQEIDLETLTSTISEASSCVSPGIWATNQATTPGGSSTHDTIPFTFNPTTDFHEYRIDWISEATTFYIDGRQVAQLTSNVPTASGHWIWNVWSNGDPCWSNGPPTADSITQIRSIDILKGYTPEVVGTACPA